jgi:hypothetical protein
VSEEERDNGAAIKKAIEGVLRRSVYRTVYCRHPQIRVVEPVTVRPAPREVNWQSFSVVKSWRNLLCQANLSAMRRILQATQWDRWEAALYFNRCLVCFLRAVCIYRLDHQRCLSRVSVC